MEEHQMLLSLFSALPQECLLPPTICSPSHTSLIVFSAWVGVAVYVFLYCFVYYYFFLTWTLSLQGLKPLGISIFNW